MHDDLRHHPSQEKPKQTERKFPIGPIMSILHDLQRIAFEVDLLIEVHLMKCFHWDLAFAMVPCSILLIVEMQIVFDRPTRVPCLLVLTWGD